MQTLTINIQNHALVEKVVCLLEHFKHDGLEITSKEETIKTALDKEIDKRIQEYHTDTTQTSPLHAGLDKMRNELLAKI